MSSNFYARTLVKFTHVKKIEAMYQTSRVNVKVERGSTPLRLRGPSLHCLYFIYARKIYVCACARKNHSTVEIHLQRNVEGPQ